ncbi:MAG: hypothetical protein M1831_004326 [Alyxoria varia]|nr:MAG: hypothetical protein M1831_004326 [Alyxoria varia]
MHINNRPFSYHPRLRRRQVTDNGDDRPLNKWNYVNWTPAAISSGIQANISPFDQGALEEVAKRTAFFISNLRLDVENAVRIFSEIPNRVGQGVPADTVVHFWYSHTTDWAPGRGFWLENGRTLMDDAHDRILSGALSGLYHYDTGRGQEAVIAFTTFSEERYVRARQRAGRTVQGLTEDPADDYGLDYLPLSETRDLRP